MGIRKSLCKGRYRTIYPTVTSKDGKRSFRIEYEQKSRLFLVFKNQQAKPFFQHRNSDQALLAVLTQITNYTGDFEGQIPPQFAKTLNYLEKAFYLPYKGKSEGKQNEK